MNSDIPLILPEWDVPSNIMAYCSTRDGGVSEGNYATLNVGLHVGDDAELVEHNRQYLPAYKQINWLNQVHGYRVVDLPCEPQEADASISRTPDAFCAVMTADCVPVLLCNGAGTEVAAVHAGWKGLHLKIIEHTVAKMFSSPDQLRAWVGPAISQACYEVPDSVATNFIQYPGAVVRSANPDKYLVDLPLVAQYQLETLGVDKVVSAKLCTYQDPRFFSHRRATHNGVSQTGRMVSVIGITN